MGERIDNSMVANPPAGSILRAETVPAYGGDTQWTNLVAAYNGLSKPLQQAREARLDRARLLFGDQPNVRSGQVVEVRHLWWR